MKRRLLLACGSLLAIVAPAFQVDDDNVIRVDVRLVRVLATVKDSAGKLLGDLDRGEFAIYDNDVKQEISVFERRTEQPLSVALLVDCSGSTAKDLNFEVDSVSHFLKALFKEGNPQDTVSLFAFNYRVSQKTQFTNNHGQLDRELRKLKGEAGTSMYDAMFSASRELEHRSGRRVVLVVTDGGDTTSTKDYHAALEAAQTADAVIYPVLVIPISNDAGRNIGGEHALTTLALGTGGRVFEPVLGTALDQAFTDILQELRTQYLLAYYPRKVATTKERFHHIELRILRPGLQIQSRNGYYGDALK